MRRLIKLYSLKNLLTHLSKYVLVDLTFKLCIIGYIEKVCYDI